MNQPKPSDTRAEKRNTWLAKLVICVSTVVALATSRAPSWVVEDEQRSRVALDVRSQQQLILSIELGGALYADAIGEGVLLSARTDRAASDFTLVARSLTPPSQPLSPPSPDAGAELESGTSVLDARPTLEAPTQASLYLQLECVERPLEARADTCADHFEITLARESERPLIADLEVSTRVVGQDHGQPTGTFQVSLKEVPP